MDSLNGTFPTIEKDPSQKTQIATPKFKRIRIYPALNPHIFNNAINDNATAPNPQTYTGKARRSSDSESIKPKKNFNAPTEIKTIETTEQQKKQDLELLKIDSSDHTFSKKNDAISNKVKEIWHPTTPLNRSNPFSNFSEEKHLQIKRNSKIARSLSTPNSTSGNAASHEKVINDNEFNKVQNQLLFISSLFKKLGNEEAIAVNLKTQFFYITKIQDLTLPERKKSVVEIIACIATGIKFALTNLKDAQGNALLQQLVENLPKKNWSISVLKKSKSSILKFNTAKESVTNAYSAKLVGLLLTNKIDNKDIESSTKILLNDLSIVYPKLITLQELLRQVLELLLNEPPLFDHEKIMLGEFCTYCFQNRVGLNFYPDDEINKSIEKICLLLSQPLKTDLKQIYEESCRKTIKAQNKIVPKIESLNSVELEEVDHLRSNIETGKWNKETVASAAQNLNHKLREVISQVPLDELLSGKLTDKNFCPKFSLCTMTIDNMTYLAAEDILTASSEKGRQQVIQFYIQLIDECLCLGDFASAFALRMCFDLHIISRLKKTWEEVPTKISDKISTYNKLFSYDKNYQALHAQMDKFIETKDRDKLLIQPPFLFSQKATGLEEVPTYDDHNFINQQKFSILSRKLLQPFQKMQCSTPAFTKTKGTFYRRLEGMELSRISDKSLELLSQQIQPSLK